ncbi:MAG: hypothetical protein PHO26_09130 [Dehalococcoidia bacterium]|nr:hypothetical protein [Dehalococcoidia bacterium]MDD5495210.1 hypothetical protein [Dehalococcoidia bacterium]
MKDKSELPSFSGGPIQIPVIKRGWDSGLLQIQGGAKNKKKLVMQIWYEYTAPEPLPLQFWWYVKYLLRAEDKNWSGKWKTTSSGQLYNFVYSFTYNIQNTAITKSNTITFSNKDNITGTLFGEGHADPFKFPVFTQRHAAGQRYGGDHGITLTWDA